MFKSFYQKKVKRLLSYDGSHPGNEDRLVRLYDSEVVEANRLLKKTAEYTAAHLKVLAHARRPVETELLFHKVTYGPNDVSDFLLDCSQFGWRNIIEIFDANLGEIPSKTPILLKEHLSDRIRRGFRQKLGSRKNESEVVILTACYFRFLHHVFSDDREIFERVIGSLRSEQDDRPGADVLKPSIEYVASEAARIAGEDDRKGIQKTLDSYFPSIFDGWGLLFGAPGDVVLGADEHTWPGRNISSQEEAAKDLDKPFAYPAIPVRWAILYENESRAE